MIDHDIHHGPAQVHDGDQFILCLLIGVADLKKTGRMLGYIEDIPAGSGENGIPHGAQESNILDHHLAADTGFPAKGPAG